MPCVWQLEKSMQRSTLVRGKRKVSHNFGGQVIIGSHNLGGARIKSGLRPAVPAGAAVQHGHRRRTIGKKPEVEKAAIIVHMETHLAMSEMMARFVPCIEDLVDRKEAAALQIASDNFTEHRTRFLEADHALLKVGHALLKEDARKLATSSALAAACE